LYLCAELWISFIKSESKLPYSNQCRLVKEIFYDKILTQSAPGMRKVTQSHDLIAFFLDSQRKSLRISAVKNVHIY
jgi:hypothetical protein